MMSSYRDLFSQACKQGLPPHEVQLLLEHLTALSRTALLLRMDDPAPDRLVQQLNELVQQRLTGYPLQYLLGDWDFFGLPCGVRPAAGRGLHRHPTDSRLQRQ